MSLYKDLQNGIHDDMDGTATHLLPDGCILITQAEADAILLASIIPIPLSVLAQSALDKSDITMLRCVETGITVPVAWNTYRKALRTIANGTDKTSTALPVQPVYPTGT